ncbi:MAG: hypothetical protein KF911_08240 [Pseudomonadales bacterium]|nr:hypothetical protein [Pseudomonadales bacterium]
MSDAPSQFLRSVWQILDDQAAMHRALMIPARCIADPTCSGVPCGDPALYARVPVVYGRGRSMSFIADRKLMARRRVHFPMPRWMLAVLACLVGLWSPTPAIAGPDLGWGTPFEVDRLPILPTLPGGPGDVAVGADGTRWVFYRELATTGAIVKPEWLVFFYRRPGDPAWSSLGYSGIGGNTSPLVDTIGGVPVLAALGDGRALLAYRRITFGGIHVLLVDPAQDEARVDFIRSNDDCPFARNPKIAAAGATAMVTWFCSPTVGGLANRAEAAYFDGTTWSAATAIPGLDENVRIAGDPATGRFLAIGGRYLPASDGLVAARAVSSAFDPATGWPADPEILLDLDAGFERSAFVFPEDVTFAEDGSALALWRGGADDMVGLWAAYRDPQGDWSPAHVLVPEAGGEDGSNARAATAAGRFAVTWFGLLTEPGSDDPFGPIDPEGPPAAEVLARSVRGALRLADGNWTIPVDLHTEDGATDVVLLPRPVAFPNGSFSAIWAEPVDDASNALIRSATVPSGASCWRPTVALDGPRRVMFDQVNIAADLEGGFLASWVRPVLGESFGTTLALEAEGPDGSGGSDSCEDVVDTDPDPFSFAPLVDQPLGALVASDVITITGINAPAPVSVTGGQYSIDGGPFTGAAGTVAHGQQIVVRQTTANASSTTTNAVLEVGTTLGTFSVTTGDIDPQPFTFAPLVEQSRNTAVQSNAISVLGISIPAPISITGGQYSINGGPFTGAVGTVTQGQQVVVRLTTANSASTARTATLTIGGVSGAFTATTRENTGGGGSVDLLSMLLLALLAGVFHRDQAIWSGRRRSGVLR